MEISIQHKSIPKCEMDSHSRNLLNCVVNFFENAETQKDFEAWHLGKYGCLPKEASYIKK